MKEPLPVFHTKRLVMRSIVMEDAPYYQKHFADYEVISHLAATTPWPYPLNGAAEYIRVKILPNQGINLWAWGIFLKGNLHELIGAVMLYCPGTPENRGFWLGRAFWGQGYMTEAVKPLTNYAFDHLGFDTLVFSNAVGNIRSRRIKEKTGAKLAYTAPRKFVNPAYIKHEVWELKKSDWQKHLSTALH